MQQLYCYLLLGAYCMYAFFYLPITSFTLAGFLLAVIFLCLSIYFERKLITESMAFLYTVIGFFFPEIYLFFPLIMGELGRMRLYPPMFAAAFGLTIHFPPLDFFHLGHHSANKAGSLFMRSADISLENLCYILLGCMIALFLTYLSARTIYLEQQYKKSRDDSAESNFILQDRNRLLIEKQDYEIHNAMLQERNRIAREIHDNAGHMLSRCILLTGMIKTMNTDEKCKESLQLLDNELAKTMDTMRDSVHNLHNDAMNLEETIQGILTDFTFCPVAFDYDMGQEIPSNIKYTFLTITKEALTNITKHSDATNVHIRMTEHPAVYQLIISDNGSGKKQDFSYDGIGLENIRERIAALRGTLQISREKGFRIFATIPKERREWK